MRPPVKSESDAFWQTVGAVLVIAVAIAIGLLSEPLLGVAAFVVLAAAAAVAYLIVGRLDRPEPLGDALHGPHPHGAAAGERHLLVIANQALSGRELRDRIADDGVEVDVLAPVLTSHARYGVSDVDREIEAARERLDRSLAWAREQGIAARGEVGDPSPTTAIADELRDFGADEVIVVTHPDEGETWQERGELERLRRELDVPVTHVVVNEHGVATTID
jgi:hypothetical protein